MSPRVVALRRVVISALVLVVGMAVASGCGTSQDSPTGSESASVPSEDSEATTTEVSTAQSESGAGSDSESEQDEIARTIDSYRDFNERQARLRANEPRDVPNSALAPRHLNVEAFPVSLVDRNLIVNGGPPPDGIAPIDEPNYEAVADVDWLDPDEAVLTLIDGDEAQAYPIRIVMWHEIVNTAIGDDPVVVTYCPLCSTGVAFDRVVDGELFDFGTSGSLYQSNLVMYDRQTESLWTQFDGVAVVGDRVETQLPFRPVATVSWAEFAAAHPDGQVLSLDTGFDRPYGRNLYASYEDRDAPLGGYFSGDADPTLPAYERVIGFSTESGATAVPAEALAGVGITTVEDVVVWHVDGMTSPLSGADVAGGEVIGSTGAFVSAVDGVATNFSANGDGTFVDAATGSTWNGLGQAVAGPAIGQRLERVGHIDAFWFSWATFQPDTAVHLPG